MKANHRVIVDCDQSADDKRLRSVLQDWGYSEKEIQQFLSEMSTQIYPAVERMVEYAHL